MHTSSLTNPRIRSTAGTVTFLRRLVWNVLPGLMLLGAVKMTLLGDEGMLNRHQVKRRLYATQAKWAGEDRMQPSRPGSACSVGTQGS